jgi:WD40 repeat protein
MQVTGEASLQGILHEFVTGWRPDAPPDVRAWAGRETGVLAELVVADFECHWRAGRRIPVEVQLARYPEFQGDEGVVLGLVAVEMRYGPGEPNASAYVQRFPAQAAGLQQLLRAHRLVGTFSGLGSMSATAPALPERAGGGAVEIPVIGGYEILEVLGRGGMGIVYKARQEGLQRLVALKMIRTAGPPEATELARFRTEAEVVARLQHPNIVQVFGVGTVHGSPYLTLEYCGGGSLAAQLNNVPRPPGEAARLVECLARGMAAAHAAGIIHRDLKPANVLLAEDGTPKISDFGLAKKTDVEVGQTQTGAILGTPSYMAPEQAEGGARHVGPAADVYALGAILYELLTGRPPFRAATALETLEQVRTIDPVAPRQLAPRIPRDLETICLKCLEKAPTRRYVSAAALADDLERFRDGRPIQARPTLWWERWAKWARRRPAVAALVAVSLVALAAMSAGAWKYHVDLEQHASALQATARQLQQEQKVALIAQHKAEEQLERNRRFLFATRLQEAGALYRTSPARAFELLQDPDLHPPVLREFTWGLLMRACQRSFRPPQGSSEVLVSLSPDGRQIAAAGKDGLIRLWDHDPDRPPLVLKGHPGEINAIVYAPNGDLFASAGEGGLIFLWDPRSGEQKGILRGHGGRVVALAFAPDGKRLASCAWDNTVRQWDVATGQPRTLAKGAVKGSAFQTLTYSADGQNLACAYGEWKKFGEAKVFDTASGEERACLRGLKDTIGALGFTADGQTIVTAGRDGTVRRWDAGTGQQRDIKVREPDLNRLVALTPDGRTIAVGSGFKVKVFDTATGQELRSLDLNNRTTFKNYMASIALSWDGQRLVSGNGDGSIALFEQPLERATLRGHHGTVYAAAFTRDGQTLITGSSGSTDLLGSYEVKFWEPGSGNEKRTLPLTGGTFALAASPTADMLAVGTALGPIQLRVLHSAELLRQLEGHASQVRALAFASDGRTLASGGADNTVRLWDVATGKERARCKGHEGRVMAVAYSPDGAWLATASEDKTVKLWHAATGQEHATLRGHTGRVFCLAFAPDGKTLASGAFDQTLRLWEHPTGTLRMELQQPLRYVNAVTFSPDGKTLAVASGLSAERSGALTLWDPVIGLERTVLRGHQGSVRALAFDPRGQRLASGSEDGTIKLWEASSLVATETSVMK